MAFVWVQRSLLQIIGDDAHDALAVGTAVGLALLIEHADLGLVAVTLDLDLILLRRSSFLALAEDLAEEALGLRLGVRVHVAHIVQATAAVAVFHGEAGAVQRRADAVEFTFQIVVDLDLRLAADVDDLRQLRGVVGARDEVRRLSLSGGDQRLRCGSTRAVAITERDSSVMSH